MKNIVVKETDGPLFKIRALGRGHRYHNLMIDEFRVLQFLEQQQKKLGTDRLTLSFGEIATGCGFDDVGQVEEAINEGLVILFRDTPELKDITCHSTTDNVLYFNGALLNPEPAAAPAPSAADEFEPRVIEADGGMTIVLGASAKVKPAHELRAVTSAPRAVPEKTGAHQLPVSWHTKPHMLVLDEASSTATMNGRTANLSQKQFLLLKLVELTGGYETKMLDMGLQDVLDLDNLVESTNNICRPLIARATARTTLIKRAVQKGEPRILMHRDFVRGVHLEPAPAVGG